MSWRTVLGSDAFLCRVSCLSLVEHPAVPTCENAKIYRNLSTSKGKLTWCLNRNSAIFESVEDEPVSGQRSPENLETAVIAEPLALLVAQHLNSSEAMSALPNAPIVDDRSRIGIATERTRIRLAVSLRSVAARVEPSAETRVSHTA